MSILIKGMEIPESCAKCKFGDGYSCYATGYIVQDYDWENKRADFCPLVEVLKDMKILAQVEVQPVKYGKWKYDGKDYYCSVCNAYYCGSGSDTWSGNLKFCPYCGSKMECET